MKSSAGDITLANTSTALKIFKDFAVLLTDVPYVNAIMGLSIQILEIREQIISNKELSFRLIDNVATRSTVLIEALEQMKSSNVHLKDLEKDLARYEKLLLDIHRGLIGLTATGRSKGFMKLQTIIKRDQCLCFRTHGQY
ncbi:hypothetical protein MVEN_01099700 [Mycena venus]|uniref:Uncharacterized protein n=1 Tax=Mycena venus TaxID=2733690 RepID=A0A8H6Y4P1_9AGAR|nr:hypothetical protein MVEN_01099700 [Mycena venus]